MREAALAGSFWPSKRQKLLLRVALAGADESVAAWRALRPTLDLDELETGSYALLPLVHRQLQSLEIDEPLLPRLRGIYRRTWYVNQLLVDRVTPVIVRLQERGADPLVVSSLELPAAYYGDLGLRPVAAFHVLVRPEHLARAAEALSAEGWIGPTEQSRHSALFTSPDGERCVLYSRLFHEFSDAVEDLWEAATELPIGRISARKLGPADELLNVCISGARMTPWRNVIWVADAVAVLRKTNPELDWTRLVRQATSLRATLRLRDAIVFLRREVGAPIPMGVVEKLEAAETSRRELLAHRASGVHWRVLGAPPESLTRFLRVTADRSIPSALSRLPAFLRDEWGLEHQSQVPLRAATKVVARIAKARAAIPTFGARK